MESSLHSCIIMAKRILGVSVVSFHENETDYETLIQPRLFFDGQLARDGTDFRRITLHIDSDHLLEVQDRTEVLWLMFSSQGTTIVMGPYLNDLPTRAAQLQILSAIGLDERSLIGLRDYHASIPVVIRSQVILAAEAIMECLGSSSEFHPLTRIAISSADTYSSTVDAERSYPTSLYIEHTHDLQSQFMEAVSLGNVSEAVQLFREVLIRTRPEDGRISLYRKQISNTIGRTLVRIAVRRAGVSSQELDALTNIYRLRTDEVRSVEQADAQMFELIERACSLVSKHRLGTYSPLIRKAMHQVNQRLHMKLSVANIARDIGVTSNYLSARFHQEYGKKLTAYIMDTRLERAAQLLRNSSLPILNICMSVGISDSSYFSHLFRKKYKMSPSSYRQAPLEKLD